MPDFYTPAQRKLQAEFGTEALAFSADVASLLLAAPARVSSVGRHVFPSRAMAINSLMTVGMPTPRHAAT